MGNENQDAISVIEGCFRSHGDNASLEHFHAAFVGLIKAMLTTIANGDRDLVEDIYQETFAKCIEMFRKGKTTGREYRPAYFVAMAKNCLIDSLRKKKRMESYDSLLAESMPLYDDRSADAEEDRIALQMALLALPPRDRYILEKHFFEGWNNEHLAKFIDVKSTSVPMLIRRSLEKLKKIMAAC
jgi:RNA polymerase sigma-70 factor, ECF subfamily